VCPCSTEDEQYPGLHRKRDGLQGEGVDGPLLLCPCEARSEVLHSDLESPALEGWVAVAVGPEESHKDGQRAGAPLTWRKMKRVRLVCSTVKINIIIYNELTQHGLLKLNCSVPNKGEKKEKKKKVMRDSVCYFKAKLTSKPDQVAERLISSWVLEASRDKYLTASLGNLLQGFTTLMMKNLFVLSCSSLSYKLSPAHFVLSPCTSGKSLSPFFVCFWSLVENGTERNFSLTGGSVVWWFQ